MLLICSYLGIVFIYLEITFEIIKYLYYHLLLALTILMLINKFSHFYYQLEFEFFSYSFHFQMLNINLNIFCPFYYKFFKNLINFLLILFILLYKIKK